MELRGTFTSLTVPWIPSGNRTLHCIAIEHLGLIGTSYFQWCDQDLIGRGNDGENYNCGLVERISMDPLDIKIKILL
jgi:hypothetical protein